MEPSLSDILQRAEWIRACLEDILAAHDTGDLAAMRRALASARRALAEPSED